MLNEDDETLPAARVNPVPASPDWSLRLAIDVALGASVDSILETYALQMHEYERVCADVHFAARVAGIKRELQKDGASFRLKAALQAEALLVTSWDMIHNDDVAATVRAQLIRDTVRWAGMDNPAPAAVAGAGGGFSITMNFGATNERSGPITIDAEKVA